MRMKIKQISFPTLPLRWGGRIPKKQLF